MKNIILYILILLCTHSLCLAQERISGKLLDSTDQQSLAGASVKIRGTSTAVSSNSDGRFSITLPTKEAVLVISFLGYKTREVSVTLPLKEVLVIELQKDVGTLREVVVSTGYQVLPKERATGSFVRVDNELLNRKVSTDLISRLEDVVPGLIFNRNKNSGRNAISIRGQSTLFANSEPLIVLDNFIYDGDLNNINPNDVESISVLKDAAAASIWGAKAGNGVIVITSKKGRNTPTEFSFNSNITFGDKPDLYDQPVMNPTDYIDIEKMLFERGFYQSRETSASKVALSPVVELLIAKRDGLMPASEAETVIGNLKKQDLRSDLDRYYNRHQQHQQYSLNMNGGSESHRYYISLGHDNNLYTAVGNGYRRYNLNGRNTWSLLNKKLELSTGILYTQGVTDNNSAAGSLNFYPYAKLSDAQGEALPVYADYRNTFVNAAPQVGLLDWEYRPLEEIGQGENTARLLDYRLNGSAKYAFSKSLSSEVLYQYSQSNGAGRNFHTEQSYYTRNLVNRFTQVDPLTGSLSRPVPLGGILDEQHSTSVSHNLRTQMNFYRRWHDKHELTALGGWEMYDLNREMASSRLYGYDDEHATSKTVDYITSFSSFANPASLSVIPDNEEQGSFTDRFLSWYGNAAYTFNEKYTISASGRIDRSNLFGVETNQRSVPLWSAGLAWNVFREPFYNLNWLPYLKLRLTTGYNGNIDKSLSAYTTARYSSSAPQTRLPYATIVNPPNAELRWERVKIINAGLDFETGNGILTGTLEYYRKRGLDLIGNTPFPASTGVTSFRGNTADIRGSGIDLTLSSRNLDGGFKWFTTFLFSHATDKVTNYKVRSSVNSYQLSPGTPLEGKPLYAIYSYLWAGLDPQTGDPMGYLEGEISKDYTKMKAAVTADNMVYNGPARPTVFGSLRNTFTWGPVSLSANINYRLGYFYRQESVRYSTVLNGAGGHGDYARRWKAPGDEKFTQVPSMPAAINFNRDDFYQYSEQLVKKGDHIRLQDINLSYDLKKIVAGSFFKRAQVYVYANNLGILWKAADDDLDPDFQASSTSGPVYAPVRTIAAGLKLDF